MSGSLEELTRYRDELVREINRSHGIVDPAAFDKIRLEALVEVVLRDPRDREAFEEYCMSRCIDWLEHRDE